MNIETVQKVVVVETSATNFDILDTIKWVCLQFRKPIPGKVCLSTGTSKVFSFWLERVREFPVTPSDNVCWRGLVDAAVVALKPSIEHPKPCRGLELDFKAMLRLAAVEYPVMVDSGLILLGYSTALIPIQLTDDNMVLWHLEVATHDSQLKVSQLQATRKPWCRVQSFEELQSRRALLGWCSKAEVLLGTNRLEPTVR